MPSEPTELVSFRFLIVRITVSTLTGWGLKRSSSPKATLKLFASDTFSPWRNSCVCSYVFFPTFAKWKLNSLTLLAMFSKLCPLEFLPPGTMSLMIFQVFEVLPLASCNCLWWYSALPSVINVFTRFFSCLYCSCKVTLCRSDLSSFEYCF